MNEQTTRSLDAQDPLVGTTLDERFEIKELLGTGATGRVYRARHVLLERDVAVKLLHDHLANDAEIRRRFKREFVTAGVLEHPFIAKVYSASDATNEKLYLVMDYIDGQPLSSMLAAGPLKVEQFFRIFDCLLSALQYAHSAGVIHRDIKPGNIMVSADTESAVLVDFGIARLVNPQTGSDQKLTATGTIQGTSSYMSPEQCIGKQVDARSDIYSLGCVMYESMTGRPPYNGESAYDVMYKHLNDSVSKLKHLDKMPASVAALISRCLQKNVHERYQNIEALRQDFDKCKRERPTEQSHASSGPKMPVVVVCSATILGLALIVAAPFIHSKSTTRELDRPRTSKHSPVALSSQHLQILCENEFKKSSFGKVVALCEDWFAKNKNATVDIDSLNSRLMQAQSYVALKQTDKSKALFRLIIEHKNSTAVLKAEALCGLANVEASKSKSTLLSLARELTAVVEVLEGETTYEHAANSQVRCLKTIADLHLRCGDQKMAETYLIKATKFCDQQSMDASDSLTALANVYSDQNKNVEAQQLLLKAMHSPTMNRLTATNSLEAIAKAFRKINDDNHAEEAYKLAIERAALPQLQVSTTLTYAAFLNDKGRYTESRNQYGNLLQNPSISRDTHNINAALHAFIATSFLLQTRPKDAADSLRKALSSLLSLKMSSIDLKRFDDVLRLYITLALDQDQRTQCRIYFQGLLASAKNPMARGILYLRLADLENQITGRQATQYFQLALSDILSSGDDKASGALATEACSRLVNCARAGGDKAAAMEALERTTRWCEEHGQWNAYFDLNISMAALEDATNNKKKAASLLDALSNNMPRPGPTRLSEILLRLCYLYVELGENNKAKQCLEHATKVISTIEVSPIKAERHCEGLQAALSMASDESQRNEIYQQLHPAVVYLEQMQPSPVAPLALATLEHLLARHFRDTGDKKNGMMFTNKAINRLKNTGNDVTRADLQVIKARWLCEDQRIKQGIILLEDALRQLPDYKNLPAASATDIQLGSVRLQNQLAEFYVKTNRIEESKKLFAQCLESADPLDATEAAVFRLNFAAALLTAGVEKTLAEQLLRTALPVLKAGGPRTSTHLSRASSLLEAASPSR